MELMLVSIFGIIVLTGAYQMLNFASIGQTLNTQRALMANDVGVMLDIEDRYFSQNIVVSNISDYSATLTIPTSVYSATYTVTFVAASDGTLKMIRTRSGVTDNILLSTNNANVAAGVPLFEFVDDSIPYVVTNDTTLMRAVYLTIVAKTTGPDPYQAQSTRYVMFRNR